MNTILPQLERDLCQAAERRAAGRHAPAATRKARPPRRARTPLLAAAALLATTAAALAATGVIPTGSPVRPSGPVSATTGEGLPAPGSSRLLPLRVADPDGGLPWGMRLVRTTRGELCLQVGRVQDGQIGELGIDGAFGDDGRFHPLPRDVLPADAAAGVSLNATCQLAGTAFTANAVGVDRSAAVSERNPTGPLGDLRNLSYGLLGPNAVRILYAGGASAPLAGTGAYLLVTPAITSRTQRVGESGVSIALDGAPPSPDGALRQIVYRACVESLTPVAGRACPRPKFVPLTGRQRDLHQRLPVTAGAGGSVNVHFTAPYAVTSSGQAYEVDADGALRTLERDVARGQRVCVPIVEPFANAHGRPTVTVTILYDAHTAPGGFAPRAPRAVVIGRVRLSRER
ncbi:MAG TPA: hypothetical protein VHX88_11695 [Solirubrobacteraceae bacterium]|jgi:hypothetical protein|nr:hypothetical protein [Solirubrobacteraceae bacterium]